MLPTTNDPPVAGSDPPKPAPLIPYHAQFALAMLVTISLGVIGAIQVADPVKLGLTPSLLEWLKIVTVGLGILAGFLPRVTARPNDDRTGRD